MAYTVLDVEDQPNEYQIQNYQLGERQPLVNQQFIAALAFVLGILFLCLI